MKKIDQCIIENCKCIKYKDDYCRKHYLHMKRFNRILSLEEENKLKEKCEICNSDKGVCLNTKTGLYLCQKHQGQVSEHGKVLEYTIFEPNQIIQYDNYAELILVDRYGKETARSKISLDKVNKVALHKWRLRSDLYIESKINKKTVLLHKYIMNIYGENEVDHINKDRLNNLNENLRPILPSQNQMNRNKQSNNTSGVIGVTWDKSRSKWKVAIDFFHKRVNIGRFDDFDEAVKARLEAENKYFGIYAPQSKLMVKYGIIPIRNDLQTNI